jgi:hypothetical protein
MQTGLRFSDELIHPNKKGARFLTGTFFYSFAFSTMTFLPL